MKRQAEPVHLDKETEGLVLTLTTWRGVRMTIEVLPDGCLWLETPGYFLPGTNQSISCVPGEES